MTPARAALYLLAATAVTVGLSSCFPRMARQASIRPYERQMPQMPAGTVPRSGTDRLPSADEARRLESPLESTPEVIAKGSLYYGYYCAMCHGPDGLGRTPVGEAYDPKPAELDRQEVQGQSDGALYRAILIGKGHEPVLQPTVPPERRWYIVEYIRTFGRAPESATGSADAIYDVGSGLEPR